MSSSIRAVLDDIADVKAFLHTHNIEWGDLTLEEKHLARLGDLDKLKQRLEARGRLPVRDLQREIDDDIFRQVQADQAPPAGAEEYAAATWYDFDFDAEPQGIPKLATGIDFDEWDGVVPDDAELFWDDGRFAFYRDSDGSVYISESPGYQVTEDEEEHDIRTMIRVLDNIAVVMEEIRTNLVRKL